MKGVVCFSTNRPHTYARVLLCILYPPVYSVRKALFWWKVHAGCGIKISTCTASFHLACVLHCMLRNDRVV